MLTFKIEQIAIILPDFGSNKTTRQQELFLEAMGCREFAEDTVIADGTVLGLPTLNKAKLRFNYEIGPVEFELLKYTVGHNWRDNQPGVSHLGMHVTPEELEDWRKLMDANEIKVVQEVKTVSHTNPKISGSRRYNYVIFGTRQLIGVDLKFIVRLNVDGSRFIDRSEGQVEDSAKIDSLGGGSGAIHKSEK